MNRLRFVIQTGFWGVLFLYFLHSPLQGVTLTELRQDRLLTPQKLMGYFTQFNFQLRQTVQPPDQFLSTQTGDCDDFATLAAMLLREKGYSTHLIVVFMQREAHVVCYVEESKSYLDFNNRKKAAPLVKTDGSLADMADKVSASFHGHWTSVLEYISKNGPRETVRVDFPQN